MSRMKQKPESTTEASPPGPASSRIKKDLEDKILTGDLKAGARLDENALATLYGVSRTPVREALRELASAGLVSIRARRVATVAQLTTSELIEFFEAMAELEASCAYLAATRLTATDGQNLTAAHAACIEAASSNDPDRFYAANGDFHEALYKAARNRFIGEQASLFRRRLEPYRRIVTYHPGRIAVSIKEHQLIVDAILAMEPEAAAAASRAHLDFLRRDIAIILDSLR
ncbi:GntR family transcriptional regulator [Microvirga alba]|uniref:GntR family transcriptional regulator n=1 Tax=Microvirga alba TaxID=2791025 RepID=A0A931BWH9_9HYPH|nr:GntR family transcriptional regulator [Microvirga alba]MBF9235135.1 GntR family transcriptional regulator [Microvirga alba]